MPPASGHHQKPVLFDLPRPAHPLTPPDTDYETLSHQAIPPALNSTGLELDPSQAQLPPTMMESTSPFASPYASFHRKKPSVTYVSSGLREARERTVQPRLRWLVVVLPPASITKEHGHLGHTLSSGPQRRLSSGLLMPLYPTLSSQLGAIAREFSFPSISGLSVYLHTNHSGISLAPRVSDESWPMLWGHLFDPRSPSLPAQQLPISGHIEFDIDIHRARWYDTWIASSRRDFADVPQSVAPSRAQSISHWRHDSQTSINEPADEQLDAISLAQQQIAARGQGRNIKKLSLLDRFDAMSVRSGSKLILRDESPPSVTGRTTILSPIVQEDEPMTAKKDFDHRVNSWRMSASNAARSPLAATGQTSLDPVNMPNTIEDLPTGTASGFELNLDDYTWSISSAGPLDYEMESVLSWSRVPSVHLDRRGEGSVCLTPSVATSFGPDYDYNELSPLSYTSRLPSPDIAWRMYEDVPPTPTTATSWGAPLEYPPSPAAWSYAPSIDIAERNMSSRPMTPTTATSWGPPSEYPRSPAAWSYAPSIDIAGRYMSSRPPFPYVFPYYDAPRASSWSHVWALVSYDARRVPIPSVKRISEAPGVVLGYPVIDLYPAVYPSFDIYPALISIDTHRLPVPAIPSGAPYPIFDLYPAVYPNLVIYPAVSHSVRSLTTVVAVKKSNIYPVVLGVDFTAYPHSLSMIYSRVTSTSSVAISVATSTSPSVDRLQAVYPAFEICECLCPLVCTYAQLCSDAPVYPHNLARIYPSVVAEMKFVPTGAISVGVEHQYPVFDICKSELFGREHGTKFV
ncbi:uncharacterized protein BXZ73DRAFT_40769 [Epithele typhae]|uniref:uncharacterized protein n=1 Tax=Epithele typhae TaxID=378194 RepID=UPI0020084E2C|nr:uncharacterized protein BXZ73DRAFT_40769 [Epithele typhae]KAH9943434.1 hypothetical protein BXZ73DRAFT_40769 [Epithele typhae]